MDNWGENKNAYSKEHIYENFKKSKICMLDVDNNLLLQKYKFNSSNIARQIIDVCNGLSQFQRNKYDSHHKEYIKARLTFMKWLQITFMVDL
jgi:hypothetical protein